MISGIIFILISWLVINVYAPHLLWLAIVLTIFGSILILVKSLKLVLAIMQEAE